MISSFVLSDQGSTHEEQIGSRFVLIVVRARRSRESNALPSDVA